MFVLVLSGIKKSYCLKNMIIYFLLYVPSLLAARSPEYANTKRPVPSFDLQEKYSYHSYVVYYNIRINKI